MDGVKPGSPPASPLLADSNRDGVVDDADRAAKEEWSSAAGAIFLANLDDDDGKGAADASDDIVNGSDDEKDLARIRLQPWPDAPATASGTLTVDGELAPDAVRLFLHDGADWTVLALPLALTPAQLATGIELGIEAKGLVQEIDPGLWDGYAVVHVTLVNGATGAMVEDRVKLRVAPFVMVNNLSAIGQLWNAYYPDTGGRSFRRDLSTMTASAMVDLEDAEGGGDVWAEDWWQIGATFMPASGGPQGMRIAQRSAQPDRGAGEWAETQLGPDVGFIWPHTDSEKGQRDPKGYSLDSFGNHDTLPPYKKGGESYPLGRIIVGGTAAVHIDPVVRAFYDAQRVQPVVQIDTAWLLVGHIDEIFSYVPAETARGWKLLVASPRRARSMLQDLVAQGNGEAQMFAGKSWIDLQGRTTPAAVSVSALLGDPEVMAASETSQVKIDAALAALKTEVGLEDDEVVELPFLFDRVQLDESGAVDGYLFVAHMPGTVNLRATNGTVGIPRPHGPVIGNADYFEKDLLDRLGSPANALGVDGHGLDIVFIEDWDDYHRLDGEVHCGTTTAVTAMPAVRWWEAGR